MDIIDTHAHLDLPEFDQDREEVIIRAGEEGVTTIVTVGINIESCRRALQLAEDHAGIWAVVGIHPQDTRDFRREDLSKLEEMAGHPRVVAIGEVGLDYYRNYSPPETQKEILKWQLEIAKNYKLPIVIHCRQAQEDMISIMEDWCRSYALPEGNPRGILHCFSADIETAEKYMQMGFYLSLGGYIGYPSSAPLRSLIKELPFDRLVVETDCPFLPPQKYRGKRNEPAYVAMTLEVLAEIKGVTLEEAARRTTQNAMKVFNLPH